MSNWLYLALDVGSAFIPFLFSFHPRLRFDKQFRFAFPAIAIVALLFIAWDFAKTALGVWGFNDDYLLGFYVYNLPVEELLFFVCIPFACLFTYHCFGVLLPLVFCHSERSEESVDSTDRSFTAFRMTKGASASKVFSLLLIIGLVTVAMLNLDKLYTTTTFFSLALLTALLQFVFRVEWLGQFYFSFVVLLIPFFIVNGILTGTGIPEQVVWYNDNENLGIRMLTIPVEDTFYGMLLQMTNVALFEWLRRRYAVEKNSGIPV